MTRAENVELYWASRLARAWREQTDRLILEISRTGRVEKVDVDFTDFAMEHSVAVIAEGFRSTGDKSKEAVLDLIPYAELAGRPPSPKIPANLERLRRMYDAWKKRGVVPPRQKNIAERIRKAYLEKVQETWQRYGRDWREGDAATQFEVVQRIKRAAGVGFARAKTISNTETTTYYNAARREIYDDATDVVGYLFVAVRDNATTVWCRTRQGSVLMKGTRFLLINTPACHWNCRSELLPLTLYTPAHLKLINDMSRRPENMNFAPLPRGWVASRAA